MLSPQEKDLLVEAVRKHRDKLARKRQAKQEEHSSTPPAVDSPKLHLSLMDE